MQAKRYAGGGRVPTTHWSLVAKAGMDDVAAGREALGELLTRYLPALQAHLVYSKNFRVEEAEDLLQDFIAAKVIENGLVAAADRQLGRFRTFLLTSLDRFLVDTIRRDSRKKRAPDEGHVVAMGEKAGMLQGDQSPADAFDVEWARRVIVQSLERMQSECEASGREDVWGVFEARVAEPTLHGAEPLDYAVLIERFALQSPSQASNVLITGKRIFARVLREVVGEYALQPDEIESEIRELREILGRIGS